MPSGFQIYADPVVTRQPEPIQETQPKHLRFIADYLVPKTRFAFDIWRHYPVDGDELTIEELKLMEWNKKQKDLILKQELAEMKNKVIYLEQQVEDLTKQLQMKMSASPTRMGGDGGRLSIVPKSLQPAQGELDPYDISMSVCREPTQTNLWRNTEPQRFTQQVDQKFTLPIDQSQYIKANIPTSTPNTKRLPVNCQRRQSRPSMAGSPTLKLSPITETSRDGNSKSSSSSSGMRPEEFPEAVLDPEDPSTYRQLLKRLSDPIDSRPGLFRQNRSMPKMRNGACILAGADSFLIQKEVSPNNFTAQLLMDDDPDDSMMDLPIKTLSCRVDRPANEWLFYICTEIHKRLAKIKTSPDIEISIMMTNPGIMYNDGSVLFDEYARYTTLQHYFEACHEAKRPFSKVVAAYIAGELIQVVKQMHACDIVHLNIEPRNILITCCPSGDDLKSLADRTSMIKLIGFERAMDLTLIPEKSPCSEASPWSTISDWHSVLKCIYKMLFNEEMTMHEKDGRLVVDKLFRGLPTDIWPGLFDGLLNEPARAREIIEKAIEELTCWISANLSFVLKEVLSLDEVVENYQKSFNETRG